jgi:hypothetical protein
MIDAVRRRLREAEMVLAAVGLPQQVEEKLYAETHV